MPYTRSATVCECVCYWITVNRCVYLSVEALGILGDSVELWETKHVLLAARSVEYPQSEWRQCSENLQVSTEDSPHQTSFLKYKAAFLKNINIKGNET